MTMETEYEVTVIETFTRKITVRAHSKHEAGKDGMPGGNG